MDEKLIGLQHFFEVDTCIKREMYKCAPPTDNGFTDEESMARYTDTLDDSLRYIFTELKCVTKDLFGVNTSLLQKICELEKEAKEKFYECGFDLSKLRKFYINYISNMKPSFVDSVKENCVGYTFTSSVPEKSAQTVNEILHYLHSFVMNNEHILQSIPAIDEKTNASSYPITLRGVESPVFHDLFTAFPDSIPAGWTDMVALSDRKLIMMVRDLGHALTIEITLYNDNTARIEYFIPKICNVDMVNALPGVNKVKADNRVGTTGVIETDIENLTSTLYDFMAKVPTDMDIVFDESVFRR